MVKGAALLKRPGFDLETAVFLAKASGVAYGSGTETRTWALGEGFSNAASFDFDNVQGYWCAAGGVALLAFRGTSNPGQWLRDARFLAAEHPWGHVHIGFLSGVAAIESALRDFDAVALRAEDVWITGHSLGGALALIAAARLKMKGGAPSLYTYGQPAVGLSDFAERFSVELPGRLWRFVNQSDIVTRVPPGPFYRHTGIVKRIVRPGVLELMQALKPAAAVEATPLAGASVDQRATMETVVAGGTALETANVTESAGIKNPLLIDIDPVPLTELEFSQLQVALGAAAGPEVKGPALESALAWFSDHAIAEYIRLLTDLQLAAGA